MKLSNSQIEIIRAQIARNIQIQSLQDDVLDHVCCALEEQEEPEDLEAEFEVAVQAAMLDVAPEGLHQLQRDTVMLLNIKHIIMKKVMYVIGLVTAITSSMGITFKILHLQGADFLLTWGLLAFTLLFLPLQVLIWYRSHEFTSTSEKLKISFAVVSSLLTATAILLRLGHLSSSNTDMLFVASTAIFSFGFLPIQFRDFYKKSVA